MPRRDQSLPPYRHHKASDRALVCLNGQIIYLGKYNSPESRELYDRKIAEWLAAGRRLVSDDPITINELAAEFITYAESYYVKDGEQTTEVNSFRQVVRTLCRLYGDESVSEFGPLALKACRQQWIDNGLTRQSINKQQGRLVRIFKWGVAEELVPESVWTALRAVEGLRKGRTNVPEMKEVPPVDLKDVQAVLPFLSPVVAAMIRLQLLTGMRPGEVCKLRPCDVDRSGKVWEYRIGGHKTEHHGRKRVAYIGPDAQVVLTPFLLRPSDAPCFSAAESREWHREQAHAARTTPESCGNRRGRKYGRAKPAKQRRLPRPFFTSSSYGKAIADACKKAWPVPKDISHDSVAVKAWHDSHRWAPNQLRHTRGTEIRSKFGLEAAQVILGHAKADVTQIYAEADRQKAIDVTFQIG
ncbi:tyrosine-type recombinase/integrase [Novipirellula maiorica]|uniref:tyrosine-type recombinase/integrase n=1 Tax=Novipirellula maiorica TaxID=1265734 RepID=UPI00034B39E1|nr:site-specific integrase [Rhodopirellula maiorica]